MVWPALLFLIFWLVGWTVAGACKLQFVLNLRSALCLQLAVALVWGTQTSCFAWACLTRGFQGERLCLLLIYAFVGLSAATALYLKHLTMTPEELWRFCQRLEDLSARTLFTTPWLQDKNELVHSSSIQSQSEYSGIGSHSEAANHSNEGTTMEKLGKDSEEGMQASSTSPFRKGEDWLLMRCFVAAWFTMAWVPGQLAVAICFAGLHVKVDSPA